MAKYELLPFQIGDTALNGVSSPALATKQELEGREFLIEDLDYSKSPPVPRAYYGNAGANRFKRIRVVRNVSGSAILPRQLVYFTGGQVGGQVSGVTATVAGEGYPADEFLPTAGCANNDLFYITVDGCAECLTPSAGDATNVFTATTAGANQWAVAATANGQVKAQDTSGVTTTLANNIQHRIGLVLSAMTTAQTNVPILIYVKKW